jgi:hypothetical protein
MYDRILTVCGRENAEKLELRVSVIRKESWRKRISVDFRKTSKKSPKKSLIDGE